jgi:pimeloyl-ACP methyl ester carboxylesterase/class 3 adenylate cyclase
MAAVPRTRYAVSGDLRIAYQVAGDGPMDLVWIPGWVSNVEESWEQPALAAFLHRLSSFSRLILFDKRGTGLSDPVSISALPTLEERMDDVRAVMDALGSKSAALLGFSEGVNLAITFAASHPSRTRALVLVGGFARRLRSPEYPWAPSLVDREALIAETLANWGEMDLSNLAPSAAHDPATMASLAKYFRHSASPSAAAALLRMNSEIDVRAVLPAISVPTLIVHRTDDQDAVVDGARWMAQQIPGSTFLELPGSDHLPYIGDTEPILAAAQEFLTGMRPVPSSERVLATVLFTDIVRSTEHAAEVGDRRWVALLQAHRALVRQEIERWRGQEIDTAGDGFLITFDGPARAIRCAQAILQSAGEQGLQVRAGLHTGEIERRGTQIGGIAVHIGARVAATARPGEVLVSSTVRDLVAGSGIRFEDRGTHALKGVPDQWRLFAAEAVKGTP